MQARKKKEPGHMPTERLFDKRKQGQETTGNKGLKEQKGKVSLFFFNLVTILPFSQRIQIVPFLDKSTIYVLIRKSGAVGLYQCVGYFISILVNEILKGRNITVGLLLVPPRCDWCIAVLNLVAAMVSDRASRRR